MNFIDWHNEFDAVHGQMSDSEDEEEESPIPGMSKDVFQAILAEEKAHDMGSFNGVQQKFYERLPVKVASADSTELSCAICVTNYRKGDKVFFLPCSHTFHTSCIMPWFNNNSVCP